MGIASLAAESARDAAAPGKTLTASPPIDSAVMNIVRFVPTEIVAIYVTVVGILGATIDSTDEPVVFYPRWLLVATILTPTFFALNFVAEYRRIHNGKWPSLWLFPIPRMIVSVVAFLIWALAVAPDATSAVVQSIVDVLMRDSSQQEMAQSAQEIARHTSAIAASLLLIVSPLLTSVDRAFGRIDPDTASDSLAAASPAESEHLKAIAPVASTNASTQSPDASRVAESANPTLAHLLAG